MKRSSGLLILTATGLAVVQVGCVGGILTCQPDANDPFQGRWKERSAISCQDQSETPGSIAEIIFCQNSFSVTRTPFESFTDYFGDYTLDPATGALTLTITGGNVIPADADLSGTVEFRSDGTIVLRDIFLGSFDGGSDPVVTCGHVLEPM